MMNATNQPPKYDADDLSFLYDFICDCPEPKISAALKRLVAQWLAQPNNVPRLPEALKKMLCMTSEEVLQICWLLAINPSTPPSVLQDLCTGASSDLLERVAENSRTGASTLADLSYQSIAEIRIAAASNPATPLASIMMLVKDNNPDVRFSIAENPNIPSAALDVLSKDENPYIKFRAEKTLKRNEIEKKFQQQNQAQTDKDMEIGSIKQQSSKTAN